MGKGIFRQKGKLAFFMLERKKPRSKASEKKLKRKVVYD